VAGGGRSALPSLAAGVGPYLDPALWCGVFSLVGGLIVRLLTSDARGEERAAGMQLVVVVGELGEKHRERVGVVLGDVAWTSGRSPGEVALTVRLDGVASPSSTSGMPD
jgi:hypothetical protein